MDRQSKSEPGDEEAGLIPNRNFVAQLSDGMTGLAKDQRAGFVCFSCELLKVRLKACRRATLWLGVDAVMSQL